MARARAIGAPGAPLAAGRAWARPAGLAAVVLCALAVHAGTLGHGFVYDDADQILRNPWIRDPRSVVEIFTSGSWDYAGVRSNYYRPLMHLVYLATHSLFGLWAPGYHLVNVAAHAVASALVFLVAEHVLDRDGRSRAAVLALATAAGLLFAAHPIHTEAVAWIGGVPDLSLAVFGLLSLHLYATGPAGGRYTLRYAGSVLAFLAALLAKETALVLPPVLVAHDLALRGERPRAAEIVRRQLPFAGAIAVYVALRLGALGEFAPVHRHSQLSPFEIAINAGPLLAGYLGKLVLPVRLSAFHAFAPVTSLLDLRAAGSLAVALAAAALGAVLLVRRRPALLAWAITFVPLLPVLYVPALGENPFAERYLYLPSAGFVLAVVTAAAHAAAVSPRARRALLAAGGLTLGACALATVARNPIWRSDVTLWEDAAAKSPGTALVQYNLGAALQASGDRRGAAAAFTRAIALQPSPLAYNGLGVLQREEGDAGAAVASLEAALRLDPRHAGAHSNLALAYLDLGLVAPAVAHLRTAVQLAPHQPDYLNNLGRALEQAGDPGEAARCYERALQLAPGHAVARRNLDALLPRRP